MLSPLRRTRVARFPLLVLLALLLLAAPCVHAQSNTVNSGASLPAACVTGSVYITTATPTFYLCSPTNTWTAIGWNGGMPAGAIMFLASGTCPASWTEVAGLSGKMIRGTVAASGNVGQTGGSDTYTPAGTISALTFTGTAWSAPAVAWPAGVPTAATESTHTHSVTAAGTNGTGTVTPLGTIAWPAGVPTNAAITAGTPAGTNGASATTGNCAATNVAIGTGATNACKATAPNLAVSAQIFTGSALGTHTHTVSWPAGVPTLAGSSSVTSAEVFTGSPVTSAAGSAHTHTLSWPAGVPTLGAFTPAGTVATPSLTGTQATVVPAYLNLIGCQKN